MVDDEGVGDDHVKDLVGRETRRLAHAVTEHLAAAELALVAIHAEVLLDADLRDEGRRARGER